MVGLRKNINSEAKYNNKGVASSNFNPSPHIKTLNKGATTVLGGHREQYKMMLMKNLNQLSSVQDYENKTSGLSSFQQALNPGIQNTLSAEMNQKNNIQNNQNI